MLSETDIVPKAKVGLGWDGRKSLGTFGANIRRFYIYQILIIKILKIFINI